jgi:lycopene beta-cyclase
MTHLEGSMFDIIILGGGASGLSLAYHIVQADLKLRVLIVERDEKRSNDRTWCFWESTPGPFETVVHAYWQNISVHGEHFSRRLEITPHRYKMIRGADFYAFTTAALEQHPNIVQIRGKVERLEDTEHGVHVWVDGTEFQARWAMNSIYTPRPHADLHREGFHALLQHFKGWMLETPTPRFDPSNATFMDFRVPQEGVTRFVYVLPITSTRALVEYTLFSPALLEAHEYDAGLEEYIRDILSISEYTVQETEFGVIPMTDAPFVHQPSPHVMNIGTAGGCTKASTGYTFRRIQQQSAQIIHSLRQTGQPFYPRANFDRHAWMDSVMLRVLATGREDGARFFTRFFERNPVHRVLEFLNEDTNLTDDLRLMSTVNIPVFAQAGLEVTLNNLKRALKSPGARGSTINSRLIQD